MRIIFIEIQYCTPELYITVDLADKLGFYESVRLFITISFRQGSFVKFGFAQHRNLDFYGKTTPSNSARRTPVIIRAIHRQAANDTRRACWPEKRIKKHNAILPLEVCATRTRRAPERVRRTPLENSAANRSSFWTNRRGANRNDKLPVRAARVRVPPSQQEIFHVVACYGSRVFTSFYECAQGAHRWKHANASRVKFLVGTVSRGFATLPSCRNNVTYRKIDDPRRCYGRDGVAKNASVFLSCLLSITKRRLLVVKNDARKETMHVVTRPRAV